MRDHLKTWIRKYFLHAGIFSFFVNVFGLTFPIYMLAIYDRVLQSFSIPTLLTISLGALLAVVVMGILDVLRSRILVLAGVEIQNSLSDTVLTGMIRNLSRLDAPPYKEGLRDLQLLRNYLGGSAIFFIFDSPWMPIYLFVVYLIHPYLAVLALAGAGVSLLLGYFQAKFTSQRLEMSRALEDNMNQYLHLLFFNAETIAAMNLFPGILKQWDAKNSAQIRLLDQSSSALGLFASATRTFRTLVPILVYGLGAYLVIRSEVAVGGIIAASIITRQFLAPVDSMVATWKQTVEARAAYKRLGRLLEDSASESVQTRLPTPQGRVSVQQVGLRIGSREILKGVSFQMDPGEVVAVIGPSGAGKSTLCRVLLGIYPATSGKVTLDGADINQWDRDLLGPHVGYLPQDVQLFNGTVAENIARLGPVDSEKVIETARLAGIHDMVLSLPSGYDTDVGERGNRLSGGQKQRIGLARAFYGIPKFVVLDEPNSNLDDQGERALLEAVKSLKEKGSSVLLVSHRPSILSVADKVLVLKDGQTAMFGPTKEVLAHLMGQPQVAPAARPQAGTPG
ncbi:MAG: type I secretion system permease/ATPase [Desulfacinum sp.]|jgi:PrtD family type I secretion system ABC transporter|nr:type I secretion system permease/ATPase [Desulfacinum sp.]